MNETEELHRLSCEARYWKKWCADNRDRTKWEERKESIRKKRGLAGLNKLLAEMNRK